MKKTTQLIICGIAGAAFLTVTTASMAKGSLEDIDLPGQIPVPSIQLNANNSSATASTSIVMVPNAITDVDHDATPLKKPGITQG